MYRLIISIFLTFIVLVGNFSCKKIELIDISKYGVLTLENASNYDIDAVVNAEQKNRQKSNTVVYYAVSPGQSRIAITRAISFSFTGIRPDYFTIDVKLGDTVYLKYEH